jgi:hypothetical protein
VVLIAQPTLIVRKKGGAGRHITTLGIDMAKNVFQLHGVDARGRAVLSADAHGQRPWNTNFSTSGSVTMPFFLAFFMP